MIAKSLAVQVVRSTPYGSFKEGGWAKFVKINDDWGLKFYDSKSVRDKSYRLQKIGHQNGIGPAIGNKVDFVLGNENKYGFITEVVDVAQDRINKKHNAEEGTWGMSHEKRNAYYHEQDEFYQQLEYLDLMSKMRKTNLDTRDMHLGNVGYTKDGRLVCLDFNLC